MVEIDASEARATLDNLVDQVARKQEIITVTVGSGRRVHLVPDGVLSAMQETLHLLGNRGTARRLLSSLDNLERGEGVAMSPAEFNQFADLAVAVAEVRDPRKTAGPPTSTGLVSLPPARGDDGIDVSDRVEALRDEERS